MTAALKQIQPHLREILAAHPAGLSEYALLMALSGRDIGLFDTEYFSSPHGLFQRHFLLFHSLYTLRDSLRASGQGDMEIHCLGIRRLPYVATSSAHPALSDPLASYYLDLDNLETTDEADVLQMLDDFWQRFAGEDRCDEALAVMALTPPVSFAEIQQQYRRLAMQHHPDRGGDSAEFQRLEQAMTVLRSVYR